MSNLNASAKRKGVVVFAFNSATVDYVALADQTSRLTQLHLNLPITLITDLDAEPQFPYDHVIRVQSQGGNYRMHNVEQAVEWRNFGRYLAYELSPYDTTILLDGDYLVLDRSLLTLTEQDFDYRLMHHSQTPTGASFELMNAHTGLPFVWATVVLFNKTPLAKQYFDFIGRIQANYSYYRNLYSGNGSYRNDYAFAIANNVLSGYSLDQHKGIPWTMMTLEEPITSMHLRDNFVVVRQERHADVIARQNLHVMNKAFLLSAEFKKFVDEVCDAA